MKYLNIIYALTLFIVFSSESCTALDTYEKNCSQWLSETLRAVESCPVEQRYQETIKQLASGCPSIPEALKEAAKNSLGKTDTDAKRILMFAAGAYFSKECMPDDPNMTAKKLLHVCFEEQWPNGDFSAMLDHVDAATYLYARALKKEFSKAGIYKGDGKKLLANFLISNAKLRE